MANINKISVNGTVYDIEDTTARASSGVGLTDDIKTALLNCLENVAWINENGQNYYDALESALYPPANLVSISCVYTQSGTVYDTDSLNVLKTDLVVTAHWDDSSTTTVTTYTLSGTLTEGTSTITVSYGGKTTTFDVTVTEYVVPAIYDWDFTQSLVDSVGGVTAQTANVTQDSEGIHMTSANSVVLLGDVFAPGHTMKIDFASTSASLGGQHGRLVMFQDTSSPTTSTNVGNGFIYRSTGAWAFYKLSWSSASNVTDADAFNGHTLIMKYYLGEDSTYHTDVYCDSNLVLQYSDSSKWNTTGINPVQLGSSSNAFRNAVITRIRIYEGV